MNDLQASQPPSSWVADFVGALEEELKAQQDLGLSRTLPVAWGRWIYSTGEHHVYQFRTGQTIKEPPDTRVRLHAGDNAHFGVLVAAKGLNVQVAFANYLGETLQRVHLNFETGFLLAALKQVLVERDPKTFHESLARYLFSPLQAAERRPRADLWSKLASEQRLFVWGPAGTGKTQTLAEIAARLVKDGETVLIAANTHRAVNNGLQRLISVLGASDPKSFQQHFAGKILRYGLMQSPEQGLELSDQLATPERVMKQHRRELWERRLALTLANKTAKDQWEEWRRNDRIHTPEAKVFRQKLLELESDMEHLRRQWQQALAQVLQEVQVLACTVAQVYLNADIARRSFDTVLIDEASMASLPALYWAAGLAKKRVVVIGDFRQLPPICTQNSETIRKFLGRDIFEVVGLPELARQHRLDHAEVHVLRSQRRMRPQLSSLVGAVFYEGLLLDDPSVEAREPQQEAAVEICDTASAEPWCARRAKGDGGSRINLLHAAVAVQLAERALLKSGAHGVAVITPYREQARLIHHLLDDRGLSEQVQVATVHQFQGEERDTIILDTVDAPGVVPSRLLQGELGSGAARLLNVALTRARDRLVIIADCAYLQKSLSPQASLHAVMAELAKSHSKPFAARSVLPDLHDGEMLLLNDLSKAERFVFISSPFFFGGLNSKTLKVLEEARARGVTLLIDTQTPRLQRTILKEAFRGMPDALYGEGTMVACHEPPASAVHPTLVQIDERVVWYARRDFLTLRAESGMYGVHRLSGHETLRDLAMFFGTGLLREGPRLLQNCPLCEGPMVLMWNRRHYTSAGDFFAACSEGCGYSRPLLRGERHSNDTTRDRLIEAPRATTTQQRLLPGFSAPIAVVASPGGTEPKPIGNLLDPCPQCKASTKLRFSADRYLFIGCSRFPECQFKRPYQEQCPSCTGNLVVRRSAHGIFLGCINYPRCRGKRDVPASLAAA